MKNLAQNKKLRLSFNKVGPIEIAMIQRRVISNIVKAKTNIAKQTLVYVGIEAMCEMMRRIYVRKYENHKEDKKLNYKPMTFWERIKEHPLDTLLLWATVIIICICMMIIYQVRFH